MPFKDLIAERSDELTTSDRRLIDVLLVDRTEGSFLPAHEIAERAGVHPSTAGRLARKLGFESYRAMRDELRNAVLSDLDASRRVRKRVDRAAGHTLLQSVIEGEIRALSALASQVDQAAIDRTTAVARSRPPHHRDGREPCQQPRADLRPAPQALRLSGGRALPCRLGGRRRTDRA